MKLVSKNITHKDNKEPSNGVIYLKGGDIEEEIKPFKNARIINISDHFEEEYFITKKIIYIRI